MLDSMDYIHVGIATGLGIEVGTHFASSLRKVRISGAKQ